MGTALDLCVCVCVCRATLSISAFIDLPLPSAPAVIERHAIDLHGVLGPRLCISEPPSP